LCLGSDESTLWTKLKKHALYHAGIGASLPMAADSRLVFRLPSGSRPGAAMAHRLLLRMPGWAAFGTMRTTALSLAILLGVLVAPSRAEEPTSRDQRFDLWLATEVGLPRGYVQVRENEIQGTHLSFHSDLRPDRRASFNLHKVTVPR
jgi:hypothetical protein